MLTLLRGASGLKNMEVMGTSDPYANIALGSRKYPPLPADCLYRTKTIDNNLHPTWDETFELDVCSTELQQIIPKVRREPQTEAAGEPIAAQPAMLLRALLPAPDLL